MNLSLELTSDTLLAAAKAVNKNVEDNLASLSEEQISAYTDQAAKLLIKARTLIELATIEIAEKAGNALKSLSEATDTIQKTIKSIKSFQKMIDITSKLILLGTTITGHNITEIPQIVTDIFDMLIEK